MIDDRLLGLPFNFFSLSPYARGTLASRIQVFERECLNQVRIHIEHMGK